MLAQTDFIFDAVRPKDSYISMHKHNCFELVYYQSGSGISKVGPIEYRYSPHTYAIIRPGTQHDERRFEETDVLCVGFRVDDTHRLPTLYEGLFKDDNKHTLEGILGIMKEEMQEKKPLYAVKLDLCISEALVEHMRNVETLDPARQEDNLMFAINYMDEHYNEIIRVETLSAMAGYSYHHFRHLFKQKFGVSPITYIMNKRIENAIRMLRYTDKSITSIAMNSGFSNDAQFCSIFKREVGESPRSYRIRYQENSLNK
ncbi:AraC family transcriptional regulator, transcriptional activator of pobA [Paenibacillus sp. yr247]|uniref:helix-turn-helix transcriptional regulator n=1 Tax=Paenibacillus sp. yr247 TaxID=1761880 RepID=UPI000889594B|nr:AraC family transcriptional regulator [Paenibacillus sp. yr247]SDO19080.1 AraC family transcriptional regulator, transcriptional activator of pobA [Paenibacillus sp. yr247]